MAVGHIGAPSAADSHNPLREQEQRINTAHTSRHTTPFCLKSQYNSPLLPTSATHHTARDSALPTVTASMSVGMSHAQKRQGRDMVLD